MEALEFNHPWSNEMDQTVGGIFTQLNCRGVLAWEPAAAVVTPPAAVADASTPAQPAVVGEHLDDSTLVELAVQVWRLERRVEGLDPEKHPRERKMFADSALRFARLIKQFGVEYEDPTGQAYLTGQLDVDVVSWEEPDGTPNPHGTGPWIKRAMRPIVRCGDRRLACGQVIVVDEEDR